MKSDWKDTAELVGVAAIVLGLVLVTYELKQNNEQLAEQSRQAVADGVREIALAVATTPDLARLLSGDISLEEMSRAERMQVGAWTAAWLKSAEHTFLQHQSGILDYEIWLARKTQVIGLMDIDVLLTSYENSKDLFVPGFIVEIDEGLKKRNDQ